MLLSARVSNPNHITPKRKKENLSKKEKEKPFELLLLPG
jgi:hypothetical protein